MMLARLFVLLIGIFCIGFGVTLKFIHAQTQVAQFYVQVSISGEKMAALTNAAAIINMERTGESGSPWVTPDAVFMTITIQEINAVCERLISTDPKAIVRRFNRKD